jgi:hypothetical protein
MRSATYGYARRGMKRKLCSGHYLMRGADKEDRAAAWNTPPTADPEKAERRIFEIANAVEPIQGRIHIEKINEPFLFRDRGSPAEYGAGLKLAFERGWLKMHESGTFVTARRRPILRVIAKTVSLSGDAVGGRGLAAFCSSGALSSSCITWAKPESFASAAR